MQIGFSILFAVCSIFPGFFLCNFFQDAYDEYKHTGVFTPETLIGNPALFFLCLAAFLGMPSLSVLFLMAS